MSAPMIASVIATLLAAAVQGPPPPLPGEPPPSRALTMLESALLPGLGQLALGQSRGGLFMAASGILGATAGTLQLAGVNEHDRYTTIKANPPVCPIFTPKSAPECNIALVDDSARFFTARTVTLALLAAVWAWNVIDAAFAPGRPPDA